MSKAKTFDATAVTNDLVNAWLDETRGLPVTLQLNKLGFKIIEALESAYQAGITESGGIPIPAAVAEQLMPMCPFCNWETTFVVPNSNGTFHCNNCGGDFDKDGEPVMWPDEDDNE